MGDEEFYGDGFTSTEDRYIQEEAEKVLVELRAKTVDAENAKAWLNTPLGKRLIVILKKNQMAAMRKCIKTIDHNQTQAARFDYEVYCRVETVLGLIITDGESALRELDELQRES